MKKQDLCFIKNFRPQQGCDDQEICDLKNENLSDIPNCAGVYIIMSAKTRFIYPEGTSRIIYIGKTDNLQRRLKEHKRHLNSLSWDCQEYWCCERYHYMDKYGARIYFYKCRGTQDAKELEAKVMLDFYKRYLATPVGNSARSFRK